MYTWIGYELVENIGNPNYTHSQTYNNAIPFTHTGISADVSEFLPSDKWGLVLYGVNGWDSYIDNNETKSFGTYLTYQPNDDFFISLATIYGGEGWGRGGSEADGDKTGMYNVVATYALPQVDKLSLGFDWNHGMSQNSGTNENSGSHWWAAVVYLMYDYTDNQQGAFRYEYYDDGDGVKGFDQSLWTVTYTHNITIHDNLMLRPEIRYNKYNGGYNNEVASGGNDANREDDEFIFAFGTEYVF
jgi:maltoporin